MVYYRSSPPPNEILCGNCKAEFESPALKRQTCKIYYHTICAEMPLYYMVRYASSSVSLICKLCTEKFGRISLDRDSTPVQGSLSQSYRHRKPSRQK